MVLQIFQSPPSMAWGTEKTAKWETVQQKYGSGRRKTLARWSYPEWELECSYTCLNREELDYVYSFFNRMKGSFQPFLWKDPDDYKQSNVQIGIGNGTITHFQLVRNYGGYVEPVMDVVNGTLKVYVNGTIVSHTLGDNGLVAISPVPSNESVITASFEYYWRVAFNDDELATEDLWYNFYRAKKVKLVTVR